MYARVTWLEGSASRASEAVLAIQNEALPLVRATPGFRELLFLVDRAAGRAMAVTLWESEEDLDNSEELANRLRNLPVARWAAELPERFEVAVRVSAE